MTFGTIFKYSKTNYMQKKWQHFIKKHKSYVVLTVSGLLLEGGQKGAKHDLSKQCNFKYCKGPNFSVGLILASGAKTLKYDLAKIWSR